ncbi:MAG: LssY C-terminal domain-containing protein [Bryobacteraceae bacterium]
MSAKTPSGTAIEARLQTPISSYAARVGMPLEAIVTTPVCSTGEDVLPEDAVVTGVVSKVHRVGLGLVHESASMEVDFNQLRLSDGRTYLIHAQLTAIDNARERVDSHGEIHGIRATATLSNRVGQHLALLALGHPLVALPFFAMQSAMFHFPDPEIELRRGADFHLAVQFPEEFGSVVKCTLPEEIPEREWGDLHTLVNRLPYWSYSVRQSQPMDLVNLVYVGSAEEINRAFSAAGWTGAQPNSRRATVKVMRAIAEDRGLAEAPMRMLLLDGAEPDMQLQQSLDTFAKRDHLRIWARSEQIDGRQVWASSATRDLAAVFAMHPFGFTHQIQDDVDLERDQVVSDLAFTGCVDSISYVARPETVRTSGQDYRKGVITDSRVAVITLNSCEEPRNDLSDIGEMPQPRKLVRWIRRVTLTVRNHYLRDNWVWRGGEALRFTLHTVRSWQQERKDEQLARELDAKLAARPELRQDFAVK